MCGRFASDFSNKDLKKRFDLSGRLPLINNSYNITPGLHIPVIIKNIVNTAVLMKWGFTPKWADPEKIKINPINARSEKLLTSGFYKDAFSHSRCLIPFSWFYEWKSLIVDQRSEKIPYLIKLKDEPIMGFAGIYSERKDDKVKSVYTCAIITTKPNDLLKTIHSRMPVIIDKKHEDIWMSENSNTNELEDLLKPFEAEKMEAHKISTKVNNPRNDSPDLAKPVN